jgi:hypothetical protein
MKQFKNKHMTKEELKQEIIDTFKKLSSLEKEFKEQYPDEEIGLDIKDELVTDVNFVFVHNDFPDITRQDEQWVGLALATTTGLKFHFNFHDMDNVDDVLYGMNEMKDFVEDKNENWTLDDLNED